MTAPTGSRPPETPNTKEVSLVKVKLLIMFTTLVALLAAPASALAGHFDGH
jgi:hypothetical protein